MRKLIVNADDFGLSSGVNDGVITAYEQGIVTSASLMVRGPAAPAAATYARAHPRFSVGLHLDLCEWVYRDGQWTLAYEVAPLADASAVAAEISRQIDVFHTLVGRHPSHLDSHQHVHRDDPVRSILLRAAAAMGVPVRHLSPGVRYVGGFYGQSDKGEPWPEGLSVDALIGILRSLPPGVSELGCHPATGLDAPSVYRAERQQECEILCDPRVRAALDEEHILLISFADL